MIIGRGLADRWKAAFGVDEPARVEASAGGWCAAALDLVPDGEPLFVAIAPGNVPSLKAVLAAGAYSVIGGELLFAVGHSP